MVAHERPTADAPKCQTELYICLFFQETLLFNDVETADQRQPLASAVYGVDDPHNEQNKEKYKAQGQYQKPSYKGDDRADNVNSNRGNQQEESLISMKSPVLAIGFRY